MRYFRLRYIRFTQRLTRLAPVLAPAIMAAALACREDAVSPTAPEPGPELATRQTGVLSFHEVSAGGFHNCGVTPDHRAYCWGFNGPGELGDGTTTNRLTPVAVFGGLRFRQVSAGSLHTCGVSIDEVAYCWGLNSDGQLGDGTSNNLRLTPVAVAGGLRFREVSAGGSHTCGLTLEFQAYCWGTNQFGTLGDGTTTERLTPVPVAGGLRFREVSPGQHHTCGVTPDNRAYCWGANLGGVIGDGTTVGTRLTPVAVAGGLRFREVRAGGRHTCGVTNDNRAYCWGDNPLGNLGDGTSMDRFVPVPVAGELRLRQVDANEFWFTCGVILGNRAYCWGWNSQGQLGDGTTSDHLTPVPVAGGLGFREVAVGAFHTCALTPDHRTYCWGDNVFGQLGDGTTTDRLTPVPVAGATSISSRTTSESQTPANNQVDVDQANPDAPEGNAEQE
jgi:alpha-tubulin suppressor-like RCC1 family protein